MDKSNNYYKSIYQKFKRTQDTVQINANKNIVSSNQPASIDIDTSSSDILLKCNRDILKNKREAKLLYKIQNEMMDIYVEHMKQKSHRTAKSYSNIISKFIHYSPSIDPDDLDRFIKITFNIPYKGKIFPSSLKWTSLKYYNCIHSFLKIVYNSEYSQLIPEFALGNTHPQNRVEEIPSLLEVTNAYIELMNIENFEDATIIHLMYSLGANPETITLLTFDSINEDNFIKYYDTKDLKYKEVKLNENLIRDIMFLKSINLKHKQVDGDQFRCFRDKMISFGNFIISVSAPAIYNRFSRNFGGMLRWFNYSLQQIVKLSKAMLILKNEIERDISLDLIEDTIKFAQKNVCT